ncbi:MAG: TIGR00282 family metallophosphoesterase [Patescibacteria group bacterium]
MIKILFISDIVGKIGRNAVREYLPILKKKYEPDAIIANAENLAHGIGATQKTLDEMKDAGVDMFTSGNHIWEKGGSEAMLNDSANRLIRPANFPAKLPGQGFITLSLPFNLPEGGGEERWSVGEIKLKVVNLMGKVFYGWEKDKKEILHEPFKTLDKIISADRQGLYLIDFHAEATSEKAALANYFDGRVAAVIGTHTHVQTADERILPGGTGLITDAGMVGYHDSIIGADKQQIYHLFMKTGQSSKKHDLPSTGLAVFNAVYLEIDEVTRKTIKIERINESVEVK